MLPTAARTSHLPDPSLLWVLATAGLLAIGACGSSTSRHHPGDESNPAPPTETSPPDAGLAAEASHPTRPPDARVVAVPDDIAAAVGLEVVVRDLVRPVGMEFAPGDGDRLFIVEQPGRIRIARAKVGWKLDSTPFFDIRGQVSRANEQGLLGLAFHPDFAKNRKLYVNYTNPRGATMVVEYETLKTDPNRVDMSSAKTVFQLRQPFSNHNGGDLEFGPDGMLYVGTGDGGAAGDPYGAGQNPKNLLGKMLRFDVSKLPTRPEVVAIGLRNPWRYNFDPATRDLYIADVGQNTWEEIDVVAGGVLKGHNFGWNVMEGNHCFLRQGCDKAKFVAPTIEYDHRVGCSVTGGVVYRGKALPALVGRYFYADYCTAIVRSFSYATDGIRDHWEWRPVLDPQFKLATICSFATDAEGEMYLISLDGVIYKVVPRS